VRDFAFCYYPIYFFLGVWASWKNTDFLQRCVRIAAVINGVYGLAYILFLNHVLWFFPGVSPDVEPVPVFGQPLYTAPILLGLLAFEKDLRRGALLLLLNVAVMIGMLIRAEWAAFGVGFLLLLWITKNVRKAAIVTTVAVALIAVMYVSNFSYAGPETRGRTISARDLVGQVIAPFNKDTAANFTSDDASLELSEGTTIWRTLYWIEIWDAVHEKSARSLFGFGYGYPLGSLVGYLGVVDVRTPHNFLMYVLAYDGWVGLVVYLLFQAALAQLLWKSYRATGQPFGIVAWAAMLVVACFTPLFEVPQGAIPFYLLIGGSCGALLRGKERTISRRTPNLAPIVVTQ
jgi:hypothetical protein